MNYEQRIAEKTAKQRARRRKYERLRNISKAAVGRPVSPAARVATKRSFWAKIKEWFYNLWKS